MGNHAFPGPDWICMNDCAELAAANDKIGRIILERDAAIRSFEDERASLAAANDDKERYSKIIDAKEEWALSLDKRLDAANARLTEKDATIARMEADFLLKLADAHEEEKKGQKS